MRRLAMGLLGLALAGTAAAAEPGASGWADNDAGRVRLVAATTATGTAETLRLGLHFDLKPGWKIYWRTPGDAGYPPKVDWSGSENVGEPRLRWPAPKRFVLAGLQNHGYAGEVVLPVDAPVARPGGPVRLMAGLDYLACAQICVPMQASLRLDLPAGEPAPSAFLHDIGRFDALVPGDGARHGMTVESLQAVGQGDRSFLRATVRSVEPLGDPDLFVEPAEVAAFDQPRIRLSEGGRLAVIEAAVVPGTLQRPLADGPVTVTVVDGIRSLEASLVPAAATGAPMPAQSQGGEGPGLLAAMLGAALLGGLILNLMPCVLPVLSIKVVGAIGHGGAERGHVRAAFLASAAGIVASFLALAAAAVAVKAAGQAVGWGIQFQQPAFLMVMIAILAAFAANLWGLYEVPMPAFLTAGGTGRPHHTLFGHFLSGSFATLLATPCSAPFLGTAVGFALARGPGEIVAIFAALGVGMAVPYLMVAAWPGAAQRLPRPGPWMLTLKKGLALALVGTAVWLGTILATQTGFTTPAANQAGGVRWVDFDEAAIPRLVGEGKVVFVDVTADWCITCKVNKAAVLDRGPVAERLAHGAVVPMRADWTNPSDAIARYLAAFGRYGIPFNAVYGPGAPQGIPLSELLTEAEVLAAMDKANGA